MTARRHHYIPQCYLKGFAANWDAPKLFVVDSETRKTFYTSPANIAVELDFHRIDVPGQPPDVIEQKIATFESDLGPAIRRVVEARSLSDDDDRVAILLFATLLAIKNPRMRRNIGKISSNLADTTLRMQAADPEQWRANIDRAIQEGTLDASADADAMREGILEGAFKFKMSTPAHLDVEFHLLESLLPHFWNRKWILCYGKSGGPAFVTTDLPVCLMWQDPKMTQSPGYGLPNTQIVFPISRDVAIIGAFEFEDKSIEADEDTIAMMNGNVILCANRQVYARDGDFPYILQHHSRVMRGKDLLDDQAIASPVNATLSAMASRR
jgi:Protein of unknown function (DUF4238)